MTEISPPHGRAGAWSFRVLGSLEVDGPAGPVALGPPQRRLLLLRLLSADGWPVPVERLCEDLWEGRPPSGARSSVHAHISRLRSALAVPEDAGNGMLTLTSGGYALQVAREQRDTALFEDAVQRGRRLATQRQWAHARVEAETALGLWRGTPYADADGKPFVRQETNRLSELRWSAMELLAEMLLEEGAVTRSLVLAEEIVGRNPLREVSWCVLLRGLYLVGRAGEALRRFEDVRRLLAEDLGADPGPALRRVHMAILRHETAVLSPAAGARADAVPAVGTADRTPPSGSPGPLVHGAELSRLTRMLAIAREGGTGWAVVSGGAGSGKTRLLEELGAEAERRGFRVSWVRHPKKPLTAFPIGGPLTRILSGSEARDGGSLPGHEHGTPRASEYLSRPHVLCLIDDVQGATPAERSELIACAALSRDTGALVVCAVDPGDDPGIDDMLSALVRCGAERVDLRPLTVQEMAVQEMAGLLGPGAGQPSRGRERKAPLCTG
ncbi:BTAD domain-containing putative transcriptional regulator [Streptomyces sp. NPDC019531]|uniref:BTAD domain-containing putative transcriptional regulator n=1 Tax=Streptomyces sp. NPDC019531 TaxID=3365062 RepID=UPI00384D8B31